MLTKSVRRFLVGSALLSLCVSPILARASDTPIKKPIRADAWGDPLPDGVLARLGTLRLVHRGTVSAVAVSPDGTMLASGVRGAWPIRRVTDAENEREAVGDKGIRLWDARTGQLVREVETPEAHTSYLIFSEDGTDLYGACGDNICCWNPHTGEKRWQKNTLDAGKLQTSMPVSRLVLNDDRLICIHSGRLHCEIRGANWAMGVDHHQMAVRVWKRATGDRIPLPAALQSTHGPGKDIPVLFHALAVSANGRTAAVVSSAASSPLLEKKGSFEKGRKKSSEVQWLYTNSRLRIIDVRTGDVRRDLPFLSDGNDFLCISADGSLVAGVAGKEIWLLDVASGRRTKVADDLLKVSELQFVARTQRIAARFSDQSIRVWDYTTGRQIDSHGIRNDHFHANQDSLVSAFGKGDAIHLVERASGKDVVDFVGHRSPPSVRFGGGPENTLNSLDGEQIYRWKADTWKVQQHIRRRPPNESAWFSYVHWSQGTWGTEICPDNGLRLQENEKALAVHDLKTGKLVRTLEDSAGKDRTNVFCPDGNRVISTEDKRIVFFDVATGKRLTAIEHKTNKYAFLLERPACNPAVSPKGVYYCKSDECTDVDLIQVDTGKQLRKLPGKKNASPDQRFAILQIWFSPDERFVLAEIHRQYMDGESVELAVWDTNSGALVQEILIIPRMQIWHRAALQMHSIGALAVSADRRHIALTRQSHGDIEIWDTASATRRTVLSGHDGIVTNLAFSQDGHYLASGSDDTTILVWDMNRPFNAVDTDGELAEAKLATIWQTLSDSDAARADTAIWQLLKMKEPGIAFLKAHLRPRLQPDPVRLRRLIDDLDSDNFSTRSRANTEIKQFGELALAELKQALLREGSLEYRRRVEILLVSAERATLPFGTPDLVREWRALEMLERRGDSEAFELLKVLAAGAPGSPLTVHATEVMKRLRRHPQ